LSTVEQHEQGNGWKWNNFDNVLDLDNLKIETNDDFGLKLPENATINLKGKNYIKASYCAISCLTSATFQGSGSLTVISENYGIRCISLSSEDTVRFRSGKITVSAGAHGIFSENSTLIFSSDKMEITSTDYAIKGKTVKIPSGNLTATGKIHASENLIISGGSLFASANGSALTSGRKTEISGVKISVGNSSELLSPAESYNGESYIKLVSTVSNAKKGILFGGRLPVFVDYIVFFLILIAAVSVVAVPIYVKYRKTQKLKENLNAQHSKKK
jgi:hypothetical protein